MSALGAPDLGMGDDEEVPRLDPRESEVRNLPGERPTRSTTAAARARGCCRAVAVLGRAAPPMWLDRESPPQCASPSEARTCAADMPSLLRRSSNLRDVSSSSRPTCACAPRAVTPPRGRAAASRAPSGVRGPWRVLANARCGWFQLHGRLIPAPVSSRRLRAHLCELREEVARGVDEVRRDDGRA